MSLHISHAMQWFTTPAELREIAAQMEAEWPHRSLGKLLPMTKVSGRDGLELQIIPDQDRMPK